MISFLLIKEEDILKNFGNRTMVVPIHLRWIRCPYYRSEWVEYRPLSDDKILNFKPFDNISQF